MNFRQQAALAALECVQDGMTLGLGTGNTTAYFIQALGEKLRRGGLRGVRGVPTSDQSAELARSWDIPLVSLDDVDLLDLAVDGADEVDADNQLIKGLGRALLREKIVETHARRFIVIVDEAKLSPRLGRQQPLPVEIVPFGAAAHVRWLNTLGCQAQLWQDEAGRPLVTDNGNYLARCWFNRAGAEGIPDARNLAQQLAVRPGIVEHGLFLDMAGEVLVGGANGVRRLESLRQPGRKAEAS